MKIHHIALSVLVVGMVVLGLLTYFNELGDKNAADADFSSLNKTRTRLETQRQDLNQTYTDIKDIKLELSVEGLLIPYKLIKAGWSATKSLFGSVWVVSGMISDVNRGLADLGIPLPDWLIPTIAAILTLLIIAIVVYAFFKWKFED